MLNYATLIPGEEIEFKSEAKLNSYDTLKRELDDAIMDVIDLGACDAWFDDEFLLHTEDPTPALIIKRVRTARITENDIVLCGNVMFASHDDEGNTVSLTEEAKELISSFIRVRLGDLPVYLYEAY